MNKPLNIFISYSHRDEEMFEQLTTHLSGMRREGLINDWHDRKLLPGDSWKDEIDKNLLNSQIILLLVSSDFIASDYCYEVEMKIAIEKHKAGETIVIPIILRPCDWEQAPFSKIQGLPKSARPITNWNDSDSAYVDIVKGIRAKITQLTSFNKTQVSSTNKVIKKELKLIAKSPIIAPTLKENDDFNERYEELIERLNFTGRAFKKLPDIVSSSIYHEYRNNDFCPDYTDEIILRRVREFEAQAMLRVNVEDGGVITPNFDDPAIENAMDSINEISDFIDECYPELYDRFKKENKIALDIKSARLWKKFFHVEIIV
jgi:hypothetical protein